MSFVQLRLTVAGETQLSRAFVAYEHEGSNLTTPLRRVGIQLLESVREQFDSEGAHGGGVQWQPLSASYAAWKSREFPGEPILVQTGAMRAAALSPAALTVMPHKLIYEPSGEHEELTGIHQSGEGHMPQRKIVDLNAQDRRGFERVFAEWLTEMRRGLFAATR